MAIKSVPTRGRTLDHAAFVYDFFEPILLLGKQAEYDKHILSLLELDSADRVLDLGCGTGVLTRMIADQLDAEGEGAALGIDAAAKMIFVAQKKRGSGNCRFEVMAAEDLSFEDQSFDAVVSSLFFHHVPLSIHPRHHGFRPGSLPGSSGNRSGTSPDTRAGFVRQRRFTSVTGEKRGPGGFRRKRNHSYSQTG